MHSSCFSWRRGALVQVTMIAAAAMGSAAARADWDTLGTQQSLGTGQRARLAGQGERASNPRFRYTGS